MPPPPSAALVSIEVRLRPDELAAAWRTETRRLVLPSREPVRATQRVAAHVAVAGRNVAATITGRVTSSSRHGDGHRLEIVPDETRLRALERLLAIARGASVEYPPRIPRYLASLPAVVSGPAGPTFMTTFSVSENGCGLVWTGPAAAALGAELDVRLGAGSRTVTFRSVVRWTSRTGSTSTVGVRFLAGARHTWATMLAEAARAAPPA